MPATSENVRNAIPKTTECKWGVNEIKRGVELGQLKLLFKKFDQDLESLNISSI